MRKRKPKLLPIPKYKDGDFVLFCVYGRNLLGYCCNVPALIGTSFTYLIKQTTTGETYSVLEADIIGKVDHPLKDDLAHIAIQKEFDISCVKLHLNKQLFCDLALEFKEFHHSKALAYESPLRDELVDLFDHFFDDVITLSKIRP